MTARPPLTPATAMRARLRRRRADAAAASAVVVVSLGAVGWLLVAPGELAALRLLGVGLGWWAVGAAYLAGLAALALGPRAGRATRRGT